jgi:cephalosporin-C deacetylase
VRLGVGIVGEGLGGAVAVALGALEPDLISFIAIHQPVPGFHFRKRGIPADSDVVLQPITQMARVGQLSDEGLLRVVSYFDFFNFAPEVRGRMLVSMSTEDPVATPQQVLAIYNHLGGPRQLIVQNSPGHMEIADRSHFYCKTYQWLEGLGWTNKPIAVSQNKPLSDRRIAVRQIW